MKGFLIVEQNISSGKLGSFRDFQALSYLKHSVSEQGGGLRYLIRTNWAKGPPEYILSLSTGAWACGRLFLCQEAAQSQAARETEFARQLQELKYLEAKSAGKF